MWSIPVTGVGSISPLGASWAESWEHLLSASRSRVPAREVFHALETPHLVTAVRKLDRSLDCATGIVCGAAQRLAGLAVKEALASNSGKGEILVYGASNHSESDLLSCLSLTDTLECDPHEPPMWSGILVDSLAEGITRELQKFARCALGSWVYSSCTSSLHALLLAALAVRSTPSRQILVVAVDALSLAGIAGFTAAGAATATECQPFSLQRDGMLVGEGVAAMLLQGEEYLENEPNVCILGAGMYCEKYHPTRPDPSGFGFEHAIRQALSRASFEPEDVAGLVLHGTGTVANDEAEALAVRRVFPKPPVATSVKASLGHTMGASGLFNCLVAVEAVRTGILPPTSPNKQSSIEGLDLVCESPRPVGVGSPIVATGAAFGGNYAAFVFGYRRNRR